MNKQILRDKFFKECVTEIPGYNRCKKVNLPPHDLFEWFWNNFDKAEVIKSAGLMSVKEIQAIRNKTIYMKVKKQKSFKNGKVYCLELEDGMLIETTDTFLPFYTKDAIGRKQNFLDSNILGDRSERWMVGVSVMSGCPIQCKFCATGQMKKWRNLTWQEITQQVEFIINKNNINPLDSKEFKINYTRMGEPFLNIENVKKAIEKISQHYPNAHHYISTIGLKDADFTWIKDNVTLQLSLHSLDEEHRNWLIPYKNKITIEQLGNVRTESNLKTTINLTLVEEKDFDIEKIKQYFDKDKFFIKISPINPNTTSEKNGLGSGVVEGINLI